MPSRKENSYACSGRSPMPAAKRKCTWPSDTTHVCAGPAMGLEQFVRGVPPIGFDHTYLPSRLVCVTALRWLLTLMGDRHTQCEPLRLMPTLAAHQTARAEKTGRGLDTPSRGC